MNKKAILGGIVSTFVAMIVILIFLFFFIIISGTIKTVAIKQTIKQESSIGMYNLKYFMSYEYPCFLTQKSLLVSQSENPFFDPENPTKFCQNLHPGVEEYTKDNKKFLKINSKETDYTITKTPENFPFYFIENQKKMLVFDSFLKEIIPLKGDLPFWAPLLKDNFQEFSQYPSRELIEFPSLQKGQKFNLIKLRKDSCEKLKCIRAVIRSGDQYLVLATFPSGKKQKLVVQRDGQMGQCIAFKPRSLTEINFINKDQIKLNPKDVFVTCFFGK